MNWFVVDAVEVAFKRTRTALLEPFDIWKWIKLAIIVALASSGGSYSYNSSSSNSILEDMPESPFSEIPSVSSAIEQIPTYEIGWIITALIGICVLLLIFGYIEALMDLVLIESLTKNEVRFWEYSNKFIHKGLDLFLLRLVLAIIYISILMMAALPIIMQIVHEPTTNLLPLLIASSFSLIAVLLIISVISSIVSSFINLCIPVSMYTSIGFIEALERIIANFRHDWKQIIAYWLGRVFLQVGIGVAIAVILFIVLLISILLFLLIDGIIYFILSMVVSQLALVVLIPLILIEVLLLVLLAMLGAVPVRVFMKYHMLSFLEKWDQEIIIPYSDLLNNEE